MDVGSALVDTAGDERVHQLDDGRFVDGGLDALDVGGFVDVSDGQLGQVCHVRSERSQAPDGILDSGPGGHLRRDLVAADGPDVIDGEDVGRIGHGDHQLPIGIEADGHRVVASRQVVGNESGGRRVDLNVAEVDVLEADLAGKDLDELSLVDQALIDEHPSQGEAALGLQRYGLIELVARQQTFLEQHGA